MSLKRMKQFLLICLIIIAVEIIALISIILWKNHKYDSIEEYISNGNYDSAREEIDKMSFYKDEKRYKELESKIEEEEKYQLALELMAEGNYDEAASILLELSDNEDAEALYEQAINNQSTILKKFYDEACDLEERGDYVSAKEKFDRLEDYKDSKEKSKECDNAIRRLELANVVSAGTRTVAAIDETRHVKIAVGNGNIYTSIIREIEQWNDIVSIDCMGYYVCGLTIDGKVFVKAFPDTVTYDMSQLTKLDNVIQISTGSNFVAVLTADNHVICSGKYVEDGIINTSGWEDVVQIATGRNFVVGLTTKHELLISGNEVEKLKEEYSLKEKEWANVVEIAAGGGESGKNYFGSGHIVGKTNEGGVIAIGDNKYNQCAVSDYNHVARIAAGDWHTILLFEDGTAINIGKKDEMPSQYDLENEKVIKQVSAGCGLSVYLYEDGKLGYNGYDIGNGVKEALSWGKLKTDYDSNTGRE